MCAAAGLAAGAISPSSFAAVGAPSIGVKFGTDRPNSTMAATDVAGLVPTANWNNASGATGSAANLTADVNGVATATAAGVTWDSNNTWASTGVGEENNNFTGANHTLMAGYLDNSPPGPNNPNDKPTITVTFTGLPTSTVPNYAAIIYFLGGSGGRGGNYQANGAPPTYVGDVGTTGVNGPAFVLDPGVNHTDKGNFLVFTNLTSPNLTITATAISTDVDPASFRAPINAIEIVPSSAVPEPASLGFVGLCGLALLGRRRKA
jgi:uncharacterized protein (TIGR03382 family)